MAKALKTVGMIAGAVALVATGAGAVGLIGAATASKIAGIATLVGGVANIGARALAKPPPARGSVTDVVVEIDPPTPYCMGEGYFAGVMRHRVGYGPTIKKVPNPYLWEVTVHSHGGPIEGPLRRQFDFQDVTNWYSNYFGSDAQLGAVPEADALVPPYGAAPGWSAAHKLSGQAAIGWNHRFDKDGKRYASGLPVRGGLAKWVKVYDPRKDSTFPGGAGAHRLGQEATYEWSENPALHAGTYAFGRYQNGKRVLGMGLPADAIDFAAIAAWASDCDANGWTMFGVVFEPGDRWANLKDICAAGGGEPVPLHDGIGFHWDRPRVALDTITEDDIVGDAEVTAMQSWRDRLNTIVPEFIDPASNWERVKAEPVVGASYLAEDGEPRREVWPFNFVKDPAQAGQLAAYKLVNSRELWPVTLVCGPRLRLYRPGDCLHLDLPQLGLDSPAVILRREVDPAAMTVTLTLMGETAGKHAYALGTSAVPPPTPAIGQTGEDRDRTAAQAERPAGLDTVMLAGSYMRGLAGNIVQEANGDGTVDVTIPAHTRVYGDGSEVAVAEGVLTLPESTTRLVFYDDADFDGGAVPYDTTSVAADAYFSAAHPYRHFVAVVTTVDAAGDGGSTGGSSPPGGGGWTGEPGTQQP